MENEQLHKCYAFPEFFKAFMQKTNSPHLRLPKSFNKFFKGVTPCKMILIDEGTNYWNVCLEKIEDHLILTNGWQKFAIEKRLEQMDLLVFKYDGKSVFYVKVFSKTGCRKEAMDCGETVTIVNLDKDSDKSCGKTKQVLKRKHSPTGLKINEKLDSNVIVDPSEGEGAGSKSKRACKEIASRYKGKVSGLREPKSEPEEMPPVGQANCAPLKYPSFEIYFTRWRLMNLKLPKRVIEEWNIKLTPKLNLRDENGKLWPVAIIEKGKEHYYLGDGWANFQNSHNIKEGCKCDFQFVVNKENVAQELLVHVHPPSKC